MRKARRSRLARAGWGVGTVANFLNLGPEEAAFVELKANLASELQRRRRNLNLTQDQLAERLGTSQSRVAKMEAADSTVSVDLLVRALFALGVTRKGLSKTIGSNRKVSAA